MGRPPKPIDPSQSLSALVGWKIRSLREARGWTQPDLGTRIACTGDHVSKLELGTRAPDIRTAELLDTAFGTAPYFKEHQPVLAKERIPGPARNLADHEETAATIRVFMAMVIPGLLQTEAYARTLVLVGPNAGDVEEIVAERMRRQAILDRKNPPRLLAIFDEAALHRMIGGTEVIREQLAWLEMLMARPNITIQVIPARTATHAGLGNAFTIMTFEEGGDVAHVEGVADTNQFINDPRTVNRIVETYDLIRSVALPTEDTALLIKEIRESL